MNDVVVVSAVRTAIGRGRRGTFKDTRPDDLLAETLLEATRRGKVDPAVLGDVIVGTAMPEAEQGMNLARVAAMRAGFPTSIPGATVNRFCASGLQALSQGAASIAAGWYDVALTGGVESMSMIPMGGQKPSPNPTLMDTRPEVYTPMGTTAENVATRYGIGRAEQDAFAYESHRRAIAAIESGRFKGEIHPISTRIFTGTGWKDVVVDTDEGPRRDTSMEALGALKPVFRVDGTVTAGNSSQVSDGAAAVLIASRQRAEREGWPILGSLRSYQVVGVDPEIMGVGPRYAIPKALEAAGVKAEDVGVFEINEAFACQALWCVRELGLDPAKVNPNGGAIALGHPLGCTGARLVATLFAELSRQKARYGVVSMCIGGGMGAAAVFEAAS